MFLSGVQTVSKDRESLAPVAYDGRMISCEGRARKRSDIIVVDERGKFVTPRTDQSELFEPHAVKRKHLIHARERYNPEPTAEAAAKKLSPVQESGRSPPTRLLEPPEKIRTKSEAKRGSDLSSGVATGTIGNTDTVPTVGSGCSFVRRGKIG